ncbi:SMP-30/gluconolactonase/LRE family protein [Algoriphagus halophytocola]|uniref:SMP-30/gluconolactonase/LRE family protein n=1 Tax=Algoriphagus halophytocola TaxID=2991499 RepID=A0ABY6MHZ6_9BACT|nr:MULTISPECIES: SMP-30/gluconolactonase/LRE family protein [unclassified Algoriphagus]UZD22042.1 SMP-30/gluconolactonase/LRE family protein [Algoriphagus sp. TR-M5]WBL43293.1 SMP-30/gluconolactonase/LRE family protein [Algoriphagus sp. TR-M9]
MDLKTTSITKSFYPSQCYLGESPIWHEARKSFFWVDIENGKLFEHHLASSQTSIKTFPHRLALVAQGEKNKLVLALDRRIAAFDLESAELQWLTQVEDKLPLNRFNDGKCDAKGRLWAGTMSTEFTKGAASLYRIGKDLNPNLQLDQLTISNGLAWTADNQTLYFIDSPSREIKAFDFVLETGSISFRKVAVQIPKELGMPDGMSIDQSGMLWVAHFGGSGVYCWNPKSGELIEKIEVPAPHVTSCCFGGENLDTLLITTAQENLSDDQLRNFPLSGDVFLVKTETKGFPAHPFQF